MAIDMHLAIAGAVPATTEDADLWIGPPVSGYLIATTQNTGDLVVKITVDSFGVVGLRRNGVLGVVKAKKITISSSGPADVSYVLVHDGAHALTTDSAGTA